MTQAQFTSCVTVTGKDRICRVLWTTCMAAVLAVAGLSTAGYAQPPAVQATAPLDTSKLPRPSALKQLVALPQTTIILSVENVPAARSSALALLEANGWQRFERPGSPIVQQPTSETHQLKKGAKALVLFVQTAPAHNNATSISYSEMPLTQDLPFPGNATDIRFSPDTLHLDAIAPLAYPELLAFYRAELVAAGWTLHSASDGSAPRRITTGEGMHHAFFQHEKHGALHVSAKTADNGRSMIAIRLVPASVLPGAPLARAPEPMTAPRPNPQSTVHADLGQKVDTMAQDLMKQALQPPPKAAGLDAALAAARNVGVRIDIPGAAQSSRVASIPATLQGVNETPLERDEIGGLPVPKGASSKSQERTKWRIEVSASVKASMSAVSAFYRSELSALNWREGETASMGAERSVLSFASPDGPATLTLARKGREISINLLLRKEADARKAGMLPNVGHAKIMFGSMMDADATVLIGGRSFKVGAGVGSRDPDGPSLDVAPGTHSLTVKSQGKADFVERVTVRAGDVWGVLIGPGGALSLPVY